MVIQIRNPNPKLKTTIGQDPIQTMLEEKAKILLSTATIHKILASAGLIKPREKKVREKQEITEYRKQAKALRLWQVDPKDLSDIPDIFFPSIKSAYPVINMGQGMLKPRLHSLPMLMSDQALIQCGLGLYNYLILASMVFH